MTVETKIREFADLKGHVLAKVERRGNDDGDELAFVLADGQRFRMYHDQECCESVTIEEIVGDLDDLVGEVVTAEESYGERDETQRNQYVESETWTFYRIATNRGSVVIRWYGTSNGYYSESVSFDKVR